MKPQFYLLLSAALMLASCSKQFYAPALLNNDIAYLPKPASFDSTKTSLYISGGIGVAQGANINDNVFMGTLDVSAGHAFKHANLAYGVFGYTGNISDGNGNNSDAALGSQSFYGAGGRLSGNLYKVIGNADFRYLGFEAVYSNEWATMRLSGKPPRALPIITAIPIPGCLPPALPAKCIGTALITCTSNMGYACF